MAREGVSFEQVSAVADALIGAGRTATIKAVREALGTGSPNTIHRHLAAWRAARPRAAPLAAVEVPARLAAAYLEDLQQKSAAARAEVELLLVQSQTEASELAAAGELLEAERDALLVQVTSLTTDRDQSQAIAIERAAEIERQAREIERERGLAGDAQTKTAASRLKLEVLTEKIGEQAQEIARLKTALDVSEDARQEAAVMVAALSARLDASERMTAEAEKREVSLRQQMIDQSKRYHRVGRAARPASSW